MLPTKAEGPHSKCGPSQHANTLSSDSAIVAHSSESPTQEMGDLVHIFGPEGFDPGAVVQADAYRADAPRIDKEDIRLAVANWTAQQFVDHFGLGAPHGGRYSWQGAKALQVHDGGWAYDHAQGQVLDVLEMHRVIHGGSFADACSYWGAQLGISPRSSGVALSTADLDRLDALRAEQDRVRLEAKAERERASQAAAQTAKEAWGRATPAPGDHPYLVRKRVQAHAARMVDGRLVLPIHGVDGEIMALQLIDSQGGKQFWPRGCTVGSGFAVLGQLDGARDAYIAEGFATAATVHETTGKPCVIAYSASNMPKVAQALQQAHDAAFVIVADHDESGAGERAAKETELPYVMPPAVGDMNDFASQGGDVAELLARAEHDDGLPCVSLLDEVEKPSPPRQFLSKELGLTDGRPSMVFGPPGSGKSYLVNYLALCIAFGAEAGGAFDFDAGKVLWLDSEQGLEETKVRTSDLLKGMGIDLARISPERKNGVHYSDHGIDLTDLTTVQKLRRKVLRASYDLVIVDNLKTAAGDVSENSSDVRKLLDALREISVESSRSPGRRMGTVFYVIHHTGHASADDPSKKFRPMGSTAISAGINTGHFYDGKKLQIQISHSHGVRKGSTWDVSWTGAEGHGVGIQFSPKEAQGAHEPCHVRRWPEIQKAMRTLGDFASKNAICRQVELESGASLAARDLTRAFDMFAGSVGREGSGYRLAECDDLS